MASASVDPVEFQQVPLPDSEPPEPPRDWGLVTGFGVALAATVAAAAEAGIGVMYVLQPAGLLMVLGGTLGATIVTTPGPALKQALRRLRRLGRKQSIDRRALMEEIVSNVRTVRAKGMGQLDAVLAGVENAGFREGLTRITDGYSRDELFATLDLQLRLAERQSEADAKVFESAGGYAPTIGVMGTVLGLIDVMRHFSDLTAVGRGIGTAFVSTLYGLALANLVLLPIANRIRAGAAEGYQISEMIMEGVLALRDGQSHRIIRDRLQQYVR